MKVIRALLMVVYAALIAGAATVAALRQPTTAYYTTRAAMPPDHLVQADDLQRPDRAADKTAASELAGRYARHSIPAGAKVSEESFASAPSLKDVKVALLVSVSRASLVAGVDAGKTVRLCAAEKPLGTTQAHAVFCQPSDAATCLLVIDIGSPILAALAADKRIASLRAVPENTACK
jgi:hypothetical protein